MAEASISQISATRLRIGIGLLIIWWVPLYLLAPVLDDVLGITSPNGKHALFLGIVIAQTIIGILGALAVGRQIALLVKKTSFRKVPGVAWHIMRYGEIDSDTLTPKQPAPRQPKQTQ